MSVSTHLFSSCNFIQPMRKFQRDSTFSQICVIPEDRRAGTSSPPCGPRRSSSAPGSPCQSAEPKRRRGDRSGRAVGDDDGDWQPMAGQKERWTETGGTAPEVLYTVKATIDISLH